MRNSNLMEVTYPGRDGKKNLRNLNHTQCPRIFFLHPDGNLLKDITNKEGNPKFKYYYFSTESILDSMEQVGLLYLMLLIMFSNPYHVVRYWNCPNPGRNLTKMNCDSAGLCM